MIAPVLAHVGLGANLGDAAATVRAAIQALHELPNTHLLRVSSLYRTAAWGNENQPDFVNAAATLSTSLTGPALLEQLLALEKRFGRQRNPVTRWAPRTLDLDLLLYADRIIDLPALRVPHPHLHQRAFALVPLAEIAPDTMIPGIGTVDAVLRTLDTGTVVRFSG